MSLPKNKSIDVLQFPPKIVGIRVGRIIEIHGPGSFLVDFRGNPYGPILAQRTVTFSEAMATEAYQKNVPVLLAFKDDEPSSPILFDAVDTEESSSEIPSRVVAEQPYSAPSNSPQQPVPTIAGNAVVGRVCAVRDQVPFIDYEGNRLGPIPAKATVTLRNLQDPVVILLPVNHDPVIIGQVQSSVRIQAPGSEDAKVLLHGDSIQIKATKELVLTAGSCEIRLDSRGKVTTTAEQVVSRARGVNSVQGGCVKLN